MTEYLFIRKRKLIETMIAKKLSRFQNRWIHKKKDILLDLFSYRVMFIFLFQCSINDTIQSFKPFALSVKILPIRCQNNKIKKTFFINYSLVFYIIIMLNIFKKRIEC